MALSTNNIATAAHNDFQDGEGLASPNSAPTRRRRPRPHPSLITSGYGPIHRIRLRPNIRHPPPSYLSIAPPPPGGRESPLDKLRRMYGFVSSSLYSRIAEALEKQWARVITTEVVRRLASDMRDVEEQNYERLLVFALWLAGKFPDCPLVEDMRFRRVLVAPWEGYDEKMDG